MPSSRDGRPSNGGRSTPREGRSGRRHRCARDAGRVRGWRGDRQSAVGCGSGSHGSSGYAYAGHQSRGKAHGVRARVTLLTRPQVEAGHAAAWIGVGGPDSGPNGEDEWVQVGIASLPNIDPMLYAEITQPGEAPEFVPLEASVPVGETRYLAVLEMNKQPGYWRVWVDGKPVTAPILPPRVERPLAADRDRRVVERRPSDLQSLCFQVRARRRGGLARRLVAPVPPGVPLPRPRLLAAATAAQPRRSAHPGG